MVFTDIAASSEWIARVGDAAWDDVVAAHEAQVRR